MEDIETLKARVRKLNGQATALKMNLHDLAEDLPLGWEKIPDLADRAYQAYRSLSDAKANLHAAGG